MGFSLLIAFSLLFTIVSPAATFDPLSSCSSKLEADFHLNASDRNSIHLPLHHPRSPCSPSSPLPFSTILVHDNRRTLFLSSRLRNKSSSSISTSSSTSSSPLTSGASLGVGNYITKIHLGTPSTSYLMVVDTGSSLTWLQCSPCDISCHDQAGPIFDPSASASYSSVSCSSSECASLASATLNPSACSSKKACIYQASYGDGSFSVGFLSRDTLKLGSLSVPDFIYGCGQDNEGLFGRSAALMGLAKNNLSLSAQISKKTGTYAFSYCLPTASSTGMLSLGPYHSSKFTFTPMVTSPLDDTLYFISLSAITLGGRHLSVPSSSYNMPTIIDSGTVISRLPPDVYSALKNSVVSALKKKRYKTVGSYSILDTCYAGSVNKMEFPEVEMMFEGGASIKLPARNVMIDLDDEVTCLAFAPASRVAIIGNRQQQTFSVVYDVGEGKIGFAAGGCG